jgi:hypothetical protein
MTFRIPLVGQPALPDDRGRCRCPDDIGQPPLPNVVVACLRYIGRTTPSSAAPMLARHHWRASIDRQECRNSGHGRLAPGMPLVRPSPFVLGSSPTCDLHS